MEAADYACANPPYKVSDSFSNSQFNLGRHSGAMPTGPAYGRPDDRLRIEPGISRFLDAQLRI
jgi:hypothetical protein